MRCRPVKRLRGLHRRAGSREARAPPSRLPVVRGLARLRLRPTTHSRRPFLARASKAPSTRRSLGPSRRKLLSETWLNREDRHGSRRLARLRLGPTTHAQRPFLARASRAPSTRRSLVPSRRKPLSETWLNREDRHGSRRLARLRLRPTTHAQRRFLTRASQPPSTRRSLVPSRRKPLSETWLNREDRHGSRRLGAQGVGWERCSASTLLIAMRQRSRSSARSATLRPAERRSQPEMTCSRSPDVSGGASSRV